MRDTRWIRPLHSALFVALILTTLSQLFTAQQVVFGQTNGVLPWVINTLPARGEELPVDHTITFTFNTPMDHASVEAAFGVSPAASGAFQWQNDTTVSFTPNKPFDRETAYVFTIDSKAKSSEGNNLRDTFTLKLHTTGYLTITQFLPENDGVIGLEPTITVVFNRPVVPLGTADQMQNKPVPFKSDPPITGHGEWLTTSLYSFKPSEALKGGTEYSIVFPASLKDVSGSSLKEDIVFHFKTLTTETPKPKSFSIHYISPDDGKEGTFRSPLIRVGFDAPADTTSAEKGFSLIGPNGRVIPGTFKWKDDDYELNFRPSERLDYSTKYTIKINRKNIRSKGGLPLTTDATSTFTTLGLPHIVSTNPADGSLVDPSAVFSIDFSAPMKLDDLANHIEISPKTQAVVLESDIGPDSLSARIEFSTQPSTTYKITLNTKGLVDIWGTPLQVEPNDTVYRIIGKDQIQFRYVTGALGPAVSLETDGQQMGLYNAYHQTRVFVTHRNIGTVGMTLFNLPLPFFLNASNGAPRERNEPADSLVRRWVVPVYNPQNIMRYDLLSITTNGESIGQIGNLVCVEAAPSSVAVGQKVRVVRKEVPKDEKATPSVPASLNVHNEAGTQNTAIVGEAPNGTEFNVLDGPVCADHYVWWKVQTDDNKFNGWIAEGDLKQPYIMPLGDTIDHSSSPTMLPTSKVSPLVTLKDGALAPGIYRLEMEAPEINNNNQHVTHVMLLATDNITLKLAQHEALAWVTDLKTGQPAAGLTVQFYRLMQLWNGQKVLPYGKPVVTDKDSIARMTTTTEMQPAGEVVYAAINNDGHFGLAASTWTQGIDANDFQQPTMFNSQDMALYLYTDRRLYRPGEKVYFKGTIRQRNDAVYSMSDKKLIPVDIVDPYNQTIYSKKLPVNEFGSFSDSFTIDSGGQLGEYQIIARPNKPDPTPTPQPTYTTTPIYSFTATYPPTLEVTPSATWTQGPTLTPSPSPTITPTPSPVPIMEMQAAAQPDDPQFVTQITVAHYTPPEFRVSVKPEAAHVSPGDMVRAMVDSSYYFGGALLDADVQWEVRTDPYYFYYSGSGAYSFQDYNQDQIGQDYEDDRPNMSSSGHGKTDHEGHYLIEFPAALGKSKRSLIYTIEAVVWDQSHQMVAERTQVVVDQGQFQAGVGVDNYVGMTGEKQTARVIAVNNNSEPLPNTDLDVKVVRRVWDSVQTIEPGTGRTIWEIRWSKKTSPAARSKPMPTAKVYSISRHSWAVPTRFMPAPVIAKAI